MKLVISLAVGAIILVVIFFYGLFGPSISGDDLTKSEVGSTLDENQNPDDDEPREFKGEATLKDIQTLSQNLECRISYVQTDQIEPVVGTYFVSGESVRGDFEMNAPELDGPVVSSIIFANGWFYSWSHIEGKSYGIKMDTTNIEEAETQTTRQPVPDDETVSYECFDWQVVDRSIFVPPSDVLFQDTATLFESGMEYGTVYEEGEF